MKKIVIALLVIFMISVTATESRAFFVNPDFGEAAGKFTAFAGKISKKAKKAWNAVENSKMFKAIEKGVEGAKSGLAWAKDKKENVLDRVDAAKQKAEKGKKLVEKSKDLTKHAEELKEEYATLVVDTKDLITSLDDTAKAKIASIDANNELLQQRKQLGEDVSFFTEQNEKLKKSISESYKKEVAALEQNLVGKKSKMEKDVVALQDEAIALMNEAQEYLGFSKTEVKKKLSVSKEVENTKSKMFVDPDQPESVENLYEVKIERYRTRRESIYNLYYKALLMKEELSSTAENADETGGLVDTMSGKSSMAYIGTEVALIQLEELKKYADMVVADIKFKSALAMANKRPGKSISLPKTTFNLCDYEFKPNEVSRENRQVRLKKRLEDQQKSLFDTIKDGKKELDKLKGMADDAKNELGLGG